MRIANFALYLSCILWPAAGSAQDSAEIGRIALEHLALNAAQTAAQLGDLALTQLGYP